MKRFIYVCLLALACVQLRADTVTFTASPGLTAWTIPCCLTNRPFTLQGLFPANQATAFSEVWIWNSNAGYWEAIGIIDGGTWYDFLTGGQPSRQLAPGTGIFFFNPAQRPSVFSYDLGSTTSPPMPPLLLSNTYYFRGASSGAPATYEQIFGSAPRDETALFRFIPGSTNAELSASNYRIYYFKNGTWSPETPVLAPYEPALSIFPYLSVKPTRTPANGSLLLQWPSRGRLEEADSPNGPWRDLGTVTNQFSIQPSTNAGGRRFYRAKEARITE